MRAHGRKKSVSVIMYGSPQRCAASRALDMRIVCSTWATSKRSASIQAAIRSASASSTSKPMSPVAGNSERGMKVTGRPSLVARRQPATGRSTTVPSHSAGSTVHASRCT